MKCFDILNTAHTQGIDQLEGRECGVSGVTNGCGKHSILNLVYGKGYRQIVMTIIPKCRLNQRLQWKPKPSACSGTPINVSNNTFDYVSRVIMSLWYIVHVCHSLGFTLASLTNLDAGNMKSSTSFFEKNSK